MRKYLIWLIVLACLLAGCAAKPEPSKLTANPYGEADFTYDGQWLRCLSGEAKTGIDVSIYQGDINWQAVAEAGIEFVIVRVGYRGSVDGAIHEDVNAAANLQGALDAGLEVGAYFFSQAVTVEEAMEEAAFTLNAIAAYPITMPVVFDWEHVDSETSRSAPIRDRTLLTDCALAFAQAVETAGYRPMVYFNRYQARDLFDLEALADYGFWLAQYDTPMTFPWKIDFWQYSDQGTVDGIRGKVDLNLYFPA